MFPLQAKLAQLHRHAEVMMESVLNNPNITEESVKAMAQHERSVLPLNMQELLLTHQRAGVAPSSLFRHLQMLECMSGPMHSSTMCMLKGMLSFCHAAEMRGRTG